MLVIISDEVFSHTWKGILDLGGKTGFKAVFFIFKQVSFIFGMWMSYMIIVSNISQFEMRL